MSLAVGGRWPFVARDEELALVESDDRGAVLIGDAGLGKSRLLEEVAARAELDGHRVVRVAGTQSLRSVPFGAFAGVLASDPGPGAPFDALQRGLRALEGEGGLDGVTMAVDDAHLLDDASAGLVLLATQSGARVLATVRSHEPCPEAVIRLWKDDFAQRVELAALDEEQVGALLLVALGGPLDGRSRHHFFEVTRGNLLFLRELVRHAQAVGALVERGGVWSWVTPAITAPAVLDLVRDRLRQVTPDVRELVEVLAVCEPLGRTEIEHMCSSAALIAAETDGVVVSHEAGSRHELRLVHPLYADVVRDDLAVSRRAALASRVADTLVATGARRRDDRLRVVLLRLEAGVAGDPQELNAAVQEVGTRGDLALAERLARAAIDAGGSTTSEVLLGDILYWARRHDEVVALLGREFGDDVAPAEVAHAALLVGSSLFVGLGRFEEADAWLERGAQRVGPELALELLGQRSQMLFFAGHARESMAVGRIVLDDDRSSVSARLRAYAGALVSAAVCGRLDEVEAELPTAMALVPEAGADLAVYTSGGVMIAAFIVRLFAGGLDQIDALAGALHAAALQRVGDPFVGVWSFLRGRSALPQGRLAEATAQLRDAASLLRVRDPGNVLPWALACLAQALGATGDRAGAADAMDELDAVRLPAIRHIDIDIELGRAWAASARGERSLARVIAEKIGRSLLDEAKFAVAGMALHDAIRLGADPATVLDALDAAAEMCDGPVVDAFARHAHALVDQDVDALLATSDQFETAGYLLHAAECAAGASRVAAAQGLRARQREAAIRSAALAARCGPALTPMLETIAGKSALGSLTRREQEVALLAARGSSKREIAEMLFLSVRTVGNHINHVYTKLGIASREELRAALDVGEPVAGIAE